ncbi:hypothetical protein AALP_AA1G070600 [Arabis alpina]|uniref:SHSP domain-containing protein n=1 Tax=Arabis alpina TaxID=50452 RepID=A0A087HLN6_ARAAL|nr:hypothetical protein AALP_AA1G070600 [Arabis alpina]
MKKEEVKVEIEDDTVLKISGERQVEKEDNKDTWHRVERSSGQFSRKFRLPENNVKMDQVKASMEDGVLTVETKKKTQEEKMRRYERSWWWIKEKKHMALLFITITMILLLHIKGCVGCLESEKMGLLQLKSYLKNLIHAENMRSDFSPQEETILNSWSDDGSNSDCCLWERVKCSDAIGGYVVHLSLYEIMPLEYLYWDAPRSLNLSLLHSFPQLKTFDFASNQVKHLFDPIHGYNSFQRLEKLRTLNLYDNRLNNSVLPFLSAAKSLRTLNLGFNLLKGVFPPNGLINLRELEVLDLRGNSITDVEACDGLRITKLKKLDLSYNEFSEAARLKGLENLVELRVLRLRDNNFNHTRHIGVLKDMPKLQELDLTYNKFTHLDGLGLVLPSSLQVLNLRWNQLSSTHNGYSKICTLVNLRELDLSINFLTRMPHCLGNLSYLRTLDLSDNQLNENLSSIVTGLPSTLEYLSLLDNNFTSSFLFRSLVNHTKLTIFKLSSKVGTIQAQAESSWVPLFQLKWLELHNVILGSTIPSFLVHQHDLCYVDLSDNKLTGAFPTWLVQNNTKLLTLLLKSNSLTMLRLPRLVHGLQALDISSNRIQDSIQEDIGIVFPKLRYMNFASNQFRGIIPSSIGQMKSLEMFDLSSNGLSGQLPETFLSSCYFLRILKLSNNQLQGSLGKGMLNSKNLRFLDVSDNTFSGALPHWVGRMINLKYLNMSGNQLKGPFPHQLHNLSKLQVMDISRNSFSGFQSHIPEKICQLSGIGLLDLSHNKFKGAIPSCFSNMSFGPQYTRLLFDLPDVTAMPHCQYASRLNSLENGGYDKRSPTIIVHFITKNRYEVYEGDILDDMYGLDLSSNELSGEIPVEIGDLEHIRSLNLSSNRLTGSIPNNISKLKDLESLDLSSNKLDGKLPPQLAGLDSLGYFNAMLVYVALLPVKAVTQSERQVHRSMPKRKKKKREMMR